MTIFISPMKLEKILNEYEAESRDGFVNNVGDWCESYVLKNDIGLTAKELEAHIWQDVYGRSPKKPLRIAQYVATGLIIVFSVVALYFIVNNNKSEYSTKKRMSMILFSLVEDAYAEGQADALRGAIKIRQINDSTYVWKGSPWSNNQKPINDTIKIKRQ